MKKGFGWLALLVVSFGLVFGYFKFGPREYLVARSQYAGPAYWNETELIVPVTSSGYAHAELKGVRHVPVIGLLLTIFSGSQSAILPASVDVYHFDGKELKHQTLEGQAITPIASKDVLYLVQYGGAKHDGRAWQWSGGKLVELQGAEAEHAQQLLHKQDSEDDDDVSSPKVEKGWHRADLADGDGKRIAVTLKGGTATIAVTEVKTSVGKYSVPMLMATLEAPSLAPVTLLDPAKSGSHSISKAEFETILAKSTTPRSTLNPLRGAYFLAEYLAMLLLVFSPFLISIVNIFRLKSKLMKNLPETASFPNASPVQFPALDAARLDQLTRELEALGFEQVLDFTMVSSMAIQMGSFARLMLNKAENTYAEINQIFPPRKKPIPLAASFLTYFEDGWRFSSGSRDVNGGNWILRLPRALWVAKPGARTVDLWQVHQQKCSALRGDLGVRVLPAKGPEQYFRGTSDGMKERRTMLRRKWLGVILFEFYSFRWNKKYEWNGDLANAMHARTGQVSSFAMSNSR